MTRLQTKTKIEQRVTKIEQRVLSKNIKVQNQHLGDLSVKITSEYFVSFSGYKKWKKNLTSVFSKN